MADDLLTYCRAHPDDVRAAAVLIETQVKVIAELTAAHDDPTAEWLALANLTCRWCGLTALIPDEDRPPLCIAEEEHEWGTWTPFEGLVPSAARCTHCDHGMVWNPTVDGNVADCSRCGGSGAFLAPGGDPDA